MSYCVYVHDVGLAKEGVYHSYSDLDIGIVSMATRMQYPMQHKCHTATYSTCM